MAGTNILVRQKDLIAGSGISITPDTTSGNVTIAATNTAIDEARLLPTGGKNGNILEYQEGADRGNGNDVRLLLQSALTDSASGNAAPAAVTTQGVTLTGDNSLLFSGNDSHVTAVLATDEIFAADKEWTIDFWMKPIANSSEWNYILTENTGDWGSHSIGLTWNKSKSVLEQDTGGYVASVIKAPNWPNNSIACAVGEWHFVAVEKQKTSTGWSLNYYLNGAIWLQVAFTGEFVPFTSDNPFWFGGKTTDSGRWFKGEANKLRVTAGARYGGKAFAVPDRLIDYAAPAGQPVWIEGIDRSRLLPENPASGDIPCYNATATTGGGNDENTRLLIQPSNSDHGIVDQAAGNAAPVTLENHNVTVDEEGNMVFDGSNAYLKIPANTLPSDFFNGTDEWTLDIVYNVASKSRQCLFGCSSSLRMDFLLDSDGTLQIGGGPNLGTGWPFNEDVHLTFEIYKDGASWKYTIFRNGSVVTTGTWVNADWRSVAQYVGWEGESDSRKINGKIKALRLTSGALHKGAAFQSDYPWTKPQTVGEWGKFNKSELVQSVNGVAPNESGNVILDASTIIDNSRLLPVLDALPEGYEGSLLAVQRGDGKVADENTLRLMHFNDDVRDVVTDETGTLKGNASITPTGYFDGALSINHAVVSSLSFNGLTATPTAWTMDFRVKLGRFSGDAPIVMIGTNLNETQTSLIRVDSSYIDIQATYNQRVIYKTHSLQLDTWYHFALTYDGTTYKFYVDGKLFGSGESANQFDFTRKLWFGSFYDYSTSYVSDCTIDEFRLSNVVRWTENFTPPDAPYGESLYNWGIGPKLDESRLLPETGSVSSDSVGNPVIFKAISRIDNTYWLCLPLNEDTNDRSTYDVATGVYGTVNIVSNAPSSPGGSAFFNGSSCLHGTLPAQFGASDFTVRLWMMAPTISSSSHTIFSTRRGNQTDADTFGLLCTTEGRLFIYSNGDITSRTDTPFALQSNVWYHVAVVRKSGVLTIYVNGEVYNSATFTNSLTRQIFGLGASWTGSSYSEAGTVYLTSLDVLNYAAYDEAFTTPAYQPGILAGMGYAVATDSEVTDMLSAAGIDESRLLPTGGRNGNLLEYQEGVDRGNNTDTKLLIQPATSDGLIVDQAAGNAAPVSITNSGNVVIEDNALVFTGTNSLLIPANALGMTLGGNNEFTIDIEFQLDSVKSDYATLYGSDGGGSGYQGALYFTSGGAAHFTMDLGPRTTGWTLGTKHRITIERWNDNGTWKTSVYRNGSFLASSTSGMNILSDYVFPIGSNTDSTNRNFIGKIWAFRISNKAEHRGVSFTPRELPFLPPAGQPVWVDGIDRSRLLPENPANGDIPCYSNEPPVGVNYNDANTVLLLQGSSDNTAAAPTSERLNGIVTGEFPVQEDGSILVNGTSNYITFNDADTRRVFSGEFTLETYIKTTQFTASGKRQDTNWCVVYRNGGSVTDYQWLLLSDFYADAGKFGIWPYPQMSGETFPKTLINAEFQHVAIDVYMVDGVRKFTMYRNGVPYHTGNYWSTTPADWSSSVSAAMRLFGEGTSGGDDYLSNASVMSLRVSNVARYKGVSFEPPTDGKYLNPPSGYWSKLNKAKLVQSVNGQLPDESGNVTIDVADETRLLPKVDSVPTSQSGHALVYDYQSGIDADTLCLLHLDDSTWADATGKNTITQHGSVAKVSDSGYFNKALDLSGNQSSGSLSWLTVPWLAEYEAATWTMEFFAKPTKSVVNFMFFSFGNSLGSYLSLGSQNLTNLWLGNGSEDYTGNFNFSLNTWYWFVVQYDGSAVKVYVDRQLVVQGNFTPNYVGQDLQFGNLNLVNNQDNTFIGYLDEFRWSKGLRYPTGVMEIPTQPFGSSQARFKVAEKGFVPSDSKQLLPNNPSDYDLAIYRVFPEEAAPQNLTSATSDPNWEVTWSGAYSGRVGWQAFDSDQGTTWCTYSAAVGDWLCWEYKGTEGSVLLRRYSIAKGSGNGDCPTGWKIQGSNDGSTWVDLDEQTGQSFPDNNAKEYTIPNNSTPYKFHRFYLLSWNTSNMIGTFKAWSWINSTEERKVWLPINKSEFVVADARLLPDAPSDTTNSYWLNSGPVTTQVSPASYAGSTDATWTVSLSGTFEGGDVSTLFDSDTTNGVSGTIGLETHGAVQWVRKDQVPYQIDQIVLRVHTSDIGSFPQTIYLIGYDVSVGSDEIVQEFLSPVWETESDTSTYATSFTRVCTLEVNAPAFQSYDYSIALAAGAGIEVTLQAFAAYQLDTETAWKQLNTATTTTAGLMAAADKVKLDALQQAATYINIATDFNTYKTAGSYFLKGAVHTNGPLTDSYAGTLVVVAPAELRYTTQYFTQLYTNKTFVRTYSRDNSAWSAWNRVIVDTDLATTTVAGLMSATDREKSIGLTTRGFYPNALAKSGAVDFNEVIDHGFYFIGGDTPHLNYPETYQQNGGTLQVIRNGNYLTQHFTLVGLSKTFFRSCLNATNAASTRTFTAWSELAISTGESASITENLNDPGFIKLPQGTILMYGSQYVSGSTNTIQLPVTVGTIIYQHASVWGDNSDLEALNALPMVILVEPGRSNISNLTAVTKTADGNTWSGYITWLVIGTVQ